jgi:hypothetical protein
VQEARHPSAWIIRTFGIEMNRSVILGVLIAFLLVVSVAAYVTYLSHKIELIVDSPGARIAPRQFVPTTIARARTLNLGYMQISVPETTGGELARYANTDVVVLSEGSSFLICFYPPAGITDKKDLVFFKKVFAITGISIRTWFEFDKLELYQKPITIWDRIFLGKSKFESSLDLLRLKRQHYSQTSSVELFENDRVGAIIDYEPRFTRVRVTDFRSGAMQAIIISQSVKDVDGVISAMLSAYDLNAVGNDKNAVGSLLNRAGLKVVTPQTASAAELQRLDAVIVEIQNRCRLWRQTDNLVSVESDK